MAARTKPVHRLGRQVLETVNGDIDPAVEHGPLDFLRKHALAADVGERRRLSRSPSVWTCTNSTRRGATIGRSRSAT